MKRISTTEAKRVAFEAFAKDETVGEWLKSIGARPAVTIIMQESYEPYLVNLHIDPVPSLSLEDVKGLRSAGPGKVSEVYAYCEIDKITGEYKVFLST